MSEYYKDIKKVLRTMDGSNENKLTKLDKLVDEAVKNASLQDLNESINAIEDFLCDSADEGGFKKSA